MKPVQWDRFKQVMDRFRDDGGIVLVVDDDEDARKRIRAPLSATTGQWWRPADGQQALDQVAAAVPTMVLLDLVMPVMDGFAFDLVPAAARLCRGSGGGADGERSHLGRPQASARRQSDPEQRQY